MTRTSFPLPFTSLRTLSGGTEGPYVIGAMFTPTYAAKAERLAASCERLGLPYAIHEVPAVHKSISGRGSDDLSYTKPNFIRHLLAEHKKPVLYVDADCEFVSQPDLVGELVRSGCDFAIYNWFADDCTDRFVAIEASLHAGEPPIPNRFYRFAGSVDWFTDRQLMCSGLVQFYGNSGAARALLARWHRAIAEFPGCADDAALNFTFNNLSMRSFLWWRLNVRWLPKAYARISWWIYAEPIINHPDRVGNTSKFREIKDPKGRKECYLSQIEMRAVPGLFPRDCIIDTEQHMLCKLVGNQVVPLEPIDRTFWV